MAGEATALATNTKAARLRRLWRTRDTSIRSSGIAQGRPPLAAAPESGPLPAQGLTARELISMARAARRGARAGSKPE
ncbi:hypothetical protein [Methylobacterium sp. J-068]|uniref:hypothetical protein n=1 Tax=Methylobacterium sp. J-068 TaxID=2836649 RepID=UPI001FB89B56|nr:hypothetical protein [Methylobacterium sp. J-068]MCJ2033520.1 hypothetical protein [Methylobacterium sp. J-068]